MSMYNAVLARNTENAPSDGGRSSQTVAFSHYNNLSAQLPIEPQSGKLAGRRRQRTGQNNVLKISKRLLKASTIV